MEAETRREKVRKVGGRGMKSAGKAQDKRERKTKPALAGRIPKKDRESAKLTRKKAGRLPKTKNRKRRNQADEKRPRSWIGRPKNREAGKSGNRVGKGKFETVETEKKEKDNSPCGGCQERRSGPAGPARRRGKRKNDGDVGAARTGSKNGC